MSHSQSQQRGGHANERINVSVTGQDGSSVNFKILPNIKLSKLFRTYCAKKQVDYEAARFFYEGHRLTGKLTPNKLKLENGAEICCMSYQTGGGFNIMPKTT